MKTSVLLLLISCFLTAAPLAGETDPPRIQLATVYEAGIDVSEYWVSEKLDGVRGFWDGESLWTRGGHAVNPPDWFIEDWPAVAMDGELWIGRGRFEEASGIVRTEIPDDDAWRGVQFMVFDLPSHEGNFEARVLRMRTLLSDPNIPWLRPVEQFRVTSANELDQSLKEVVEEGGEGLMLHHREAHYQVGRSDHLLKYKTYQDAEAQVVGHTPGKGKYQGMLGALVVERPGGLRFRLGSGFTDTQRAYPPAIGSWVTYRYNGFTNKGVPRFARFLRVRDELPPTDPE